MAIKYLSGDRLQGTSAERAAITLTDYTPTGDLVELGRATHSGNTNAYVELTNISTTADHLQILGVVIGGGNCEMRMGGTSVETNAYFNRSHAVNSGTPSANVNVNVHEFMSNTPSNSDNVRFFVWDIQNVAGREKMGVMRGMDNDNGDTNVPDAYIGNFSYAGQADLNEQLRTFWYEDDNRNTSTPFKTGTEIVVIGQNYSGTEVTGSTTPPNTGFWELLGEHTASSTVNELKVTEFAKKKYLKFQFQKHSSGDGGRHPLARVYVNNSEVTGSDYHNRYSENGASFTSNTTNTMYTNVDNSGAGTYLITGYICNIADKNKMVMTNVLDCGEIGGAREVQRREYYTNINQSSNQIDGLKFYDSGSANWLTGSSLKIWGHD